ncbi:MAG: monovalent cation/H(+) antiporter subunit G [Opitutaceae bacterium]|nr:monovalent cation/H(+) antiporter subunit G [Opitutaceae bacterium]
MSWLASILLVAGAAFVLVAAVGVVRLPDVLFRMHAATKAGAFGVALMLAATVLLFPAFSTFGKAAMAVIFFYLTAPTACHLLSRAALRSERHLLRLDVDEDKS